MCVGVIKRKEKCVWDAWCVQDSFNKTPIVEMANKFFFSFWTCLKSKLHEMKEYRDVELYKMR